MQKNYLFEAFFHVFYNNVDCNIVFAPWKEQKYGWEKIEDTQNTNKRPKSGNVIQN